MKYDIIFSCGHNGTVTLFGPNTERERKIWGYKNYGECAACKQARLEAENKKMAEESIKRGWAQLEGSEKQIAWATTIRINMVKELEKKCAEVFIEYFEKALPEVLSEHTSAAWWIEHRESDTFKHELIDAMRRAAGKEN